MTGRRVRSSVVLVLLAFGWLLLGPQQLGGSTTYVTAQGASMLPRFSAGDLAVLRPADDYRVGDVAAYHSPQLNTVVLHRIVAVDDGRFTLKGDNNDWLDPERPTVDQMVGVLALRVPQGGIWLDRVTGPPALGLLTFGLLTAAGTAERTRRRRRTARMSANPTGLLRRPAPAMSPLSRQLRAAGAVSGLAALLGVALGAAAWSNPLERPALGEPAGGSMTFSYSAEVPPSPAYDGTTASSPGPVFRTLTDTVDVRFDYRGEPGSVAVAARLSASNGWQSLVPLAPTETFTTDRYHGEVRLDLPALHARGQAAASVIGMPADQLTVKIVPTVHTTSGDTFAPELPLTLTPLQLTLAGDASALTVNGSATAATALPSRFDALGSFLGSTPARAFSLLLVLAGLLGLAALAGVARSTGRDSEGARIRRRYAALLVPVHPTPAPAGRPLIDVPDFAALARLAERYGLLVLHWTRSDVETFQVHDEAATYRYRTPASPAEDSARATAQLTGATDDVTARA